jgi:hypothetical protein
MLYSISINQNNMSTFRDWQLDSVFMMSLSYNLLTNLTNNTFNYLGYFNCIECGLTQFTSANITLPVVQYLNLTNNSLTAFECQSSASMQTLSLSKLLI